MATAVLVLGTNLGNKTENLTIAKQFITEKIGTILKDSHVYKTQAWGMNPQTVSESEFLNEAMEIETQLTPLVLLKTLKEIEIKMGRRFLISTTYESRIIDIDIIFYGQEIINSEKLTIPHEKLPIRKFVLVPVNEIVPDYWHPVLMKNVSQLLNECKDLLRVEPI